MMPTRTHLRLILPALLIAALMTAGCHVDQHHSGNKQDVNISTPFGGLSVKTNDPGFQKDIGLDPYPGAVLVQKKDDQDGAANVNLSFGDFHLGVKAADFTTSDSPDKVLAFYRKSLARYGDVILCRDHQPVGTPAQTQDGLTCEHDERNQHVHVEVEDGQQDLKAGSRAHQHIVSVKPQGTGTRFALVALELPRGLIDRSGNDKQ